MLFLVFLVTTIVHTGRTRIALWKSNELAFLFCPVDDALRTRLDTSSGMKVRSFKEMVSEAETVCVGVTQQEDGRKFRSIT